MGDVYVAFDERLDREVAVKILPKRLANDPDAVSRFRSEAKTLAALSHPNIITIHDVGSYDGVQFVVMELLKGSTLRDLLLSGPLRVPRALEISTAVLDGLVAAHTHQISHRDIKPENIFVTSEGQIKILDFGLAKSEEQEPPENVPFVTTKTAVMDSGFVFGSLPYMSPEQLSGKIVDERTDIYSFGCLLFEMLTGVRPFSAQTVPELIASILKDDPPTIKANLPSGLEAVVFRCVQKDPNLRFQSAFDLRSALQRVSSRSSIMQPVENFEFSVAVLYFENLSRSEDNEYIRDGMTEDVITELSKIKRLKVFSRSAVLPFRDTPLSAAEIAEKLQAQYVLEGSIQRSEKRLRVTARLVNAQQGHSIWNERYDRQLEDIFQLQDELARNIAQALRITLSHQEERALARKPTANAEAYDYYLRGRSHVRRKTRDDLQKAFQMFQHATVAEPEFGLGYACISYTCALIYVWYEREAVWFDRAIAFADQARSLDPDLPETLVAQAMLLMGRDDYQKAVELAQKAISINPQCDGAYWILGSSMFASDNFTEAACMSTKAIEASGDDYNVYVPYVHALQKIGRTAEQAELEKKWTEVLLRQLEWVPDDARARMLLAVCYAHHRNEKEAVAAAESALQLRPNDKHILYNAACTYAVLGRKTESLKYLKTSLMKGYPFIDWMQRDPDLASLHSDLEFQQLLEGSAPSISPQ